MDSHIQKAVDVADKVVARADDALSSLDREMAPWPAEFRAIMWDAIAAIATSRANDARAGGSPSPRSCLMNGD